MFKPKEYAQNEFEFVSIDELVSDNHLFRMIDNYVDFSFLLEKVRPYYSENNCRPTDPPKWKFTYDKALFEALLLSRIRSLNGKIRSLNIEIRTLNTIIRS